MTQGIHHITAISSDPQITYDFYSKVLGLRLVKKTVNQDDTETYHLFFGDTLGHPGMDLTFFTFYPSQRGERGNGLVTKISLAVPETSLHFWKDRFKVHNVRFENDSATKRVLFYDRDDQQYELVGLSEGDIDPNPDVWATDEVTKEHAIRSFYSATLHVEHIAFIEPILTNVLGYTKLGKVGNTHTFKLEGMHRGAVLEVEEDVNGSYGLSGAGTVHHIAFRAKDSAEELELRENLRRIGLQPTEVIDRFYFKSVYFRTPAGILFEIATDSPGFVADEKAEELGKKLALPPFLESQRKEIERALRPIKVD